MFVGRRRTTLIAVVWIVIAINFFYFLRRSFMSDYCNVDELLKRTSTTPSGPTVDTGGRGFTHSPGKAQLETTSRASVKEDGDDEFNGCETMEVVRSADGQHRDEQSQQSHTWCMYKNEVDLRIIILTFNRPASLLKLLNSINDLELDGDSVAIEIWIDRDKTTKKVDEQTVSTARSFQWRHGPVGVHVRRQHVGIYGQWINTWRPRSASTTEMALILEDDLSLSQFAYRWLRAARRFYADRRDDVAGLTLQSEGLITASNGKPLVRPSAENGVAFLYALMGSWGFAPKPSVWIEFQDWFRKVYAKPGFSPLVADIVMSKWYRGFEKQRKTDSMWTMWFVHYTAVVHPLYTVYNNIPPVGKRLHPETDRYCLAVNRREPGLHYHGDASKNTELLLTTWNEEFVRFRDDIPVLDFNAKPVRRTRRSIGSRIPR